MTTTTQRPWKGARIHEGVIPGQRMMYPRPVILECGQCCKPGYWYPAENRIDTAGRMCFGEDPPRPCHQWGVYSWNGHEPVEGITASRDEENPVTDGASPEDLTLDHRYWDFR